MYRLSTRAAWLCLLSLAAVIAVNGMANMIPINEQTTGAVADDLGILFTPPGFVFMIWGFIYLLLLLWVLRLFSRKIRSRSWAEKITMPFLLAAAGNVAWIFAFHYEYFLFTLPMMVLLLLSLIYIYRQISISRDRRAFDLLPFSVYLGWVSVATILNVWIVLVDSGLDPVEGWLLPGEIWTILTILIAGGLAILVMSRARDSVYPLVFIWAFIGIGIIRAEDYVLIAFTAWVLVPVLLLAIFIHLVRRRSRRYRFR